MFSRWNKRAKNALKTGVFRSHTRHTRHTPLFPKHSEKLQNALRSAEGVAKSTQKRVNTEKLWKIGESGVCGVCRVWRVFFACFLGFCGMAN